MLIFEHDEQRVLATAAEAVFGLVGDPTRHAELAGSGEVKAVRLRGDGPIGVGSTFEADEEICIGRGTQKFTAISTITEYDPPHVISWTSMPPGRPRPHRIQWWYRLEPVGAGTRITERVEVDLGAVPNVLMKLLYRRVRGPAVRAGMARTLENLERTLASSHASAPRADHPTASGGGQ
jgi:Polyketide cyclase / dehydrase and lipid transport